MEAQHVRSPLFVDVLSVVWAEHTETRKMTPVFQGVYLGAVMGARITGQGGQGVVVSEQRGAEMLLNRV